MTLNVRGRTALITGASSGLGIDFAKQLAAAGAALVLVARRAEALETLAAELRAAHGVAVTVLPADLGAADARAALLAELDARGLGIDILINNAGLGCYGPVLETDWPRLEQMLAVNVTALTHLSRALGERMAARGWGRIVQIGSTGSFAPSPLYAAYAASKAYVLSFGLALDAELRPQGVCCTTVCPGVTETAFQAVAGQQMNAYLRLTRMQSPDVVRLGLAAMQAQRRLIVTGRLNAFQAFLTRFTPRGLLVRLTGWLMRN